MIASNKTIATRWSENVICASRENRTVSMISVAELANMGKPLCAVLSVIRAMM